MFVTFPNDNAKVPAKNSQFTLYGLLPPTNNAEHAFAIKDYTASCCFPDTVKAMARVNEACDELLICHKASLEQIYTTQNNNNAEETHTNMYDCKSDQGYRSLKNLSRGCRKLSQTW